MPSRTQLVCLHEGKKGSRIDPVFINALIRKLNPPWLRKSGSNFIRLINCGGRKNVIAKAPQELKNCLAMGGNTTLMIWADLDHDREDGDALKTDFWHECEQSAISRDEFDKIVFAFAKDRLENWIEFLETGATDEGREAPRIRDNERVRQAARKLADRCARNEPNSPLPPSLEWSCRNWRTLSRSIIVA